MKETGRRRGYCSVLSFTVFCCALYSILLLVDYLFLDIGQMVDFELTQDATDHCDYYN